MKPVPASAVAMALGWAVPLVGLAIFQLIRTGHLYDVGSSACWIGLFCAVGWAVGVRPLVIRFGRRPWVSGIRLAWLGWAIGGVAIYAVLLIPVMGWIALRVLWWPAAMGAVAGTAFARLVAFPPADQPESRSS